MRFSLFLPNIHEGRFIPIGTLTPDHIFEMAAAAETHGYDGVWLGEFMETQADVREQFDEPASYYAPLVLLGALAAKTARLQLTTGVLVLPYHDPLILARELATVDMLSGGRVRLGTGLGGSVASYRRTRKVADRVNRGALMEESVAAMRELWRNRRASFRGEYFEFHDVEMYPKPLRGELPILMAGASEAVVERVGRIADGWIETFLPPARMAERVGLMRQSAEASGRAPARLEIARGFYCAIADTRDAATRIRGDSVAPGTPTGRPNTAESEFLLVGTPKDIVCQLETYRDVGVTEFNIAFFHRDLDVALEQVALFADTVIPAITRS